MSKRVLITGGAGFIGSHLADQMLERGYEVRVLDSLSPQVHGPDPRRPDYLANDVHFVRGDVRDRAVLKHALRGIDGVVHFAAAVGVGQSMYAVEHYTSVNNLGTAVLLEVLAEARVERLVVASSMSIYGEGLYRAPDRTLVTTARRSRDQLAAGQWEPMAEGEVLEPLPTPEWKRPDFASVYALSKFDQERLCLMLGEAYAIPTVALRFFNVYGPRQALSNPYTGVLAIFASRLLNDRPPLIFEDGHQQRDFVSVHDAARATCLAFERTDVSGEAINIGSGRPRSVREVAEVMAVALQKNHPAEIPGEYRVGDIRHCFADIGRAQARLGYEPAVSFTDGLEELTTWLEGRTAEDRVAAMRRELDARGLTMEVR